jgi:hypothetical protein
MKTLYTNNISYKTQQGHSLLAQCGALLCCCFFFYNAILSDNGLLSAILRIMRVPNSGEIWVKSVKLPIILFSLMGVCIFQFIQLIRKKCNLTHFIMICFCCFYVFYQLLAINVSPLD